MKGENRRDLRRALTVALCAATAALAYIHFTDREKAVKEAREEVVKIHDEARVRIRERVDQLLARLAAWQRDADPPEGFTRVRISTAEEAGMRSVTIPGRPVPLPGIPAGLQVWRTPERFWVHTFNPNTDLVQEGEPILEGGVEYGMALDFAGQGAATIEVAASLAAPPAPGQGPAEVEVLLKKGVAPPERLRGPALEVADTNPVRRKYDLQVEEDIRTVRHTLVLRTPPGAPPVRVSWAARMGDLQDRQVAIAVERTFPARWVTRRVKDGDRERELPVEIPGETVFVVGYANLDTLVGDLGEGGLLETGRWGDRIYVTDASGTVAEAIPGYPEKIRERVKLEGRTALNSLATQRVKVRAAGTREYEGFARDRVIGAFGPVEHINGGLIVEREEKRVLEDYRGIQAWHVAAALFGLLFLWPLVPRFLRRIREDTEIPRLLGFARPFIPHMAVIVSAAALYSVGQGTFAYQGKVIFDDIILSGEVSAYERLESVCWLLAAVSAGMFAVNWVKEYLGKVIQNRLVVEIRCALCEKLVNLPMSFHSKQRAGDLLSRIQNDVAETNRGLEMLFGDIISDPILIVTMVGAAFFINWRLALVVFVGLPAILVPISYFGQKIKKHARRRQAKKADVTHSINQMLSGIRVVKAFRMEDHEAKRIRAVSGNFLVEALKVARAQVTSKETLEFFSNLSVAVILGLGGYLVLEKQVTVGDLTAFAALIGRMYKSSKSLTGNYNKMQESLAGTERIFEILDATDDMADRPAARALVRPRTEFAFENVSFRYSEDSPWVLRNVSFRVPVGSSVAIVGATGSGKSTTLDLVARFYDPQEGRVTVDGVDLRDFSRTSLLSHVAVVTQEAFLFNATIAENLRYGRPGATRAEIEGAARAAFIHEEILRQQDGYETVVGERGTRLSGGQRQRITIARAILKDPPILLLDEATSALDSKSEKVVQDALANLMKDRTTFVVAHRLSTIRGVDRIIVLDGGRILEQGTHAELMEIPGGFYRRLHEIQFGGAAGAAEAGDAGAAASA